MALGGGKNFPRQKPGQFVVARTLNRPIESAEQHTRATPAPGLASQILTGVPCQRALVLREIQARLTGGGAGGIYDWQGVWGYPGHYTDLPAKISGTSNVDPAYELNSNATLPVGTHVTLSREVYTGRLVFQLDQCS
jgi:hypothetical protein